jgi:hypothetical protein
MNMTSPSMSQQSSELGERCVVVRQEVDTILVAVADQPPHRATLLDLVALMGRIEILSELVDRGVVDADEYGAVHTVFRELYEATADIAKQFPRQAKSLRASLDAVKAHIDLLVPAGGSGDTLDEAEEATRALLASDSLEDRANDVIEALDLISQAVEAADGSDAERARSDQLQSAGDELVARLLDEDQRIDADTLQEIDVAHRAMHRAMRGDIAEYEA